MPVPVKQELDEAGNARRIGSLNASSSRPEGLSQSRAMASGRKARFMPTNFARLKRETSLANGASSSGDGTASGSVDSVFADLVKAAASEGQARGGRGGGRGRGRGGRAVSQVTAFSGGGEVTQRSSALLQPGVWGGNQKETKNTNRLRKAGGGAVAGAEDEEIPGSESEQEEENQVQWTPARYHPTMLPLAPELVAAGGPGGSVVNQALDTEDESVLASELDWLRDPDANDGRLVLLQLPPVLPLLVSNEGDNAPRPATLGDLGCSLIGKLQVMESGAVRLRIGDTLLDLAAGTPCIHAQEVVLLSSGAKQAVTLGSVTQRLCAVPDLDTLFSDEPLPEYEPPPRSAVKSIDMDVDEVSILEEEENKAVPITLKEEQLSSSKTRRAQRTTRAMVLDDDDE